MKSYIIYSRQYLFCYWTISSGTLFATFEYLTNFKYLERSVFRHFSVYGFSSQESIFFQYFIFFIIFHPYFPIIFLEAFKKKIFTQIQIPKLEVKIESSLKDSKTERNFPVLLNDVNCTSKTPQNSVCFSSRANFKLNQFRICRHGKHWQERANIFFAMVN